MLISGILHLNISSTDQNGDILDLDIIIIAPISERAVETRNDHDVAELKQHVSAVA